MTKRRLIRTFAREAGLPLQKAEKYAALLLDIIKDTTWEDGEVAIAGFGIFRVKHRKSRAVLNPADQSKTHPLPERLAISFKASSVWRLRELPRTEMPH